MPADPEWLPKAEILSFEEIARIARVSVGRGVRKIRLTGGEPLVRRDLDRLVRMLVPIPGLESLGMTTNGCFLEEQAGALYAAGLRSLNVSLDTLDRERFRRMARIDGLEKTLRGIDAAARAGFRIRLNAVVMREENEDEIPALCRYGRERGFPVRFIEFMPLDGDRTWTRARVVPETEILERAAAVAPLVPQPTDPASPARRWTFADGVGEIGVIASVTRPFCGACDRIRITADGKFRTCLFATGETDLKGAMRGGATDEEIGALLAGAVREKWEGHAINTAGFVQPERAMNAIGG